MSDEKKLPLVLKKALRDTQPQVEKQLALAAAKIGLVRSVNHRFAPPFEWSPNSPLSDIYLFHVLINLILSSALAPMG